MGHLQSFLMLIARFAVAAIFIVSGIHKILHWNDTLSYMSSQGMLMPEFFLFGAICVEIGAGLALVLGWYMRLAAALLLLYLIPVTYIFHNFWDLEGAAQATQFIHFLKNCAIMGGLLALSMLTAGKYSVDRE